MESKDVTLIKILLDDKFQALSESSTDKSFLINLIKFLDFYFTNEVIVDNICNVINKENQEGLKPLEDLSQKRLDLIKEIFEKVNDHAMQIQTIINLENYIDEFTGLIDGRIQSSMPLIDALAHVLRRLVNRFIQDSKIIDPYIKQYAQINEKDEFEYWTYDIYLEEYEDQKRRYNRQKAVSLWEQQERLFTFYEVYNHFEDRKQELHQENQFMSSMGLQLYYNEIEKVLNEKPLHESYFFKRENLFEDSKALYLFAKEKLLLLENSSGRSFIPKVKLVNGSPFFGLLLNDIKVSFQENSFSYDVLRFLLKNQGNKKKDWLYAELSSELGYSELTKKQINDKFYKACWDINDKVKRESKVDDFLIFNKLQVKVNSLITLS